MSNYINKHFNKSKSVKILIHFPDHRIKTYYVIPKGEQVNVLGKSFLINEDNVYYDEKRFPTYLFRFDDIIPINALSDHKPQSIDPTELFTRSENKLASDFIRGTTGALDIGLLMFGALFVMLIIMGFGFFTLYNEIKDLNEVIGGLINV